MSSRRLFIIVTASIAVLVSVFVSASLLGFGENVLLWVSLALVGLTLTPMYLALYLNLGLGRALAHQASHDSLTGLPNRTLLRRRLERELAAFATAEQSSDIADARPGWFQGGQRHLRS